MTESIFYIFSALMLFSGLMVIFLRNPVHTVLFLIFAFFNAAALFILIGAEYVAMTLMIVYVGAVAVLFLFVVMMIDNPNKKNKKIFLSALPIAVILSIIVFLEIYWATTKSSEYLFKRIDGDIIEGVSNTSLIGMQLYTDYALQFQLAGLILLVAMIGAILLTLRHSKEVRRQNIPNQICRQRNQAISLVDVPFNKGVALK